MATGTRTENREKGIDRGSAEIGIIGGTGVYDAQLLEDARTARLSTPYGNPSDKIVLGLFEGKKVAILPRHGSGHSIPPHNINFKANIWAFKELGVSRLLATAAVGSLKEDYKPGEICITDQFIDLTKNRKYTFFDTGKVVHVSAADPFCEDQRRVLIDICKEKNIDHHPSGTYICIEGPRFSTRAESRMFRNFADIIGMTLVPEAQLCRELGLCYSNLSMITDYDVWAEKPVNIAEIIQTMKDNVEKIQIIIELAVAALADRPFDCECKSTAAEAEL